MTASNPTFSVVIPNYNNAATLARSIESVLAQAYAAHEIIVIDDGSSDDSGAVAARFGDQVTYLRQANAGVSVARNNGAAVATGDWLCFLDADDCYLPDRLGAHARWIAREPDIDFLLGDQEFRKPDGEFMHYSIDHSLAGKRLLAAHPGASEIVMTQADFEDFIADGFGEIRALSVPRATFLKLGGFPKGKKIGEDLHLVIRLCAASRKVGVVNAPLAIYYIYPTSAMRANVLNAQRGFVETLESLDDEMRTASDPVRRGYREKLRRTRLGLAYILLREGSKMAAARAVLPTLVTNPGMATLRDLLSVVRGIRAD